MIEILIFFQRKHFSLYRKCYLLVTQCDTRITKTEPPTRVPKQSEANNTALSIFEIWKLVHEHTHVCEIGLCRSFLFVFFSFLSHFRFFFISLTHSLSFLPRLPFIFVPFSAFPSIFWL